MPGFDPMSVRLYFPMRIASTLFIARASSGMEPPTQPPPSSIDRAKFPMYKIKTCSSLAAVFALLLSGCAFTPQKANISPTVSVMNSSEGSGIDVSVRVTDERPSKSLGRRGTAYGAAAEITAAQDIAVIAQNEIIAGLKKKGFAARDGDSGSKAKLVVEVRLLEYSTSQGFWTGGVHIKGALKAAATKDSKSYEKMYRSEKEERVVVVPTAETNEKWINDALSDVLTQLLDDKGLLMFLSQ